MAKLLVNVRRKGRGFAGNSRRKIANKLCKTANRRTATNHSKVITRKIRPSVITLEVKKTGEEAERQKTEKRQMLAIVVTWSSFANFRQRNQVTTPWAQLQDAFSEEFNNASDNSDLHAFVSLVFRTKDRAFELFFFSSFNFKRTMQLNVNV